MIDDAAGSGRSAPGREWPDDGPDAAPALLRRIRDTLPWAVWAAALAYATWMVASLARRLPYVDDFPFVPWVGGDRALSLSWLWRQSSEHRLIVTKLIQVGIGRFSGGDYGVVVWFDLVVLAVTAALALVVVRRTRGRSAWGDAFFPLLLLSPQLPSLNWGFHVHFVMNSVAAVTLILVAARFGLDVPVRWCWVGVAALVLLWGGGAPGLAMMPGFAGWLVWAVVRRRRVDRNPGTVLLVAAGVLGVAFGAYFVGWHGAPADRPAPVRILTTALHVATAPGGNEMNDWWPRSGIAVAAALVLTVGLLGLRLARRPDRIRNHAVPVALAWSGVAVCSLLLAIGYGRSDRPFALGLEQHYSDAVLPVAVWVYVVWDRCCSGRLRSAAGVVLALAAAASIVMNTGATVARYRGLHDRQQAFVADFCGGASPRRLTRDHYSPLLFLDDWKTTRYGAEAVPAGIRVLAPRWERTFCR